MLELLFTASLIVFCFFYYHDRKFYSPAVLFNLIWSIVYIILFLNFNDWYEISDEVFLLFGIGQFAFNSGFFISFLYIQNKISYCENFYHTNTQINISQWLIVVQIVLLVLLLPFAYKALHLSGLNGLGAQRYLFATNETGFFSLFERYIYIYIVVFPLNKAIAILCCSRLVICNKLNFSLYLAIFSMAIEAIITGGRFHFADTVFCVMIIFFIYKNSLNKTTKKNKILTIILISCFISGAVFISSMRTKKIDNPVFITLTTISDYYSIGPRLLDMTLSSPDIYGLNDLACGGFSFAGFLELLRSSLSFIGIHINWDFFGRSQEIVGQYHIVSNYGQSVNAFPTMYYYFIRDFSYFGIVLMPFCMGCFFMNIFAKLNYAKNHLFSSIIYAYLLLLILYSPCWWALLRPEYWTCLFWMIIIMRFFVNQHELKHTFAPTNCNNLSP